MAYLFDIGCTRDVWMHRIDIARAVGRPLDLTVEHDGRIVADIVAEWARLHDDPFSYSGVVAAAQPAEAANRPASTRSSSSGFSPDGGTAEAMLSHKLPL